MAPTPPWSSRFLRKDGAETTERVYEHPAKPCTVAGCDGTMYFHDRMTEAAAPHTLEFPWYATWVCAQDAGHFEVIPEAEYREILRSHPNLR